MIGDCDCCRYKSIEVADYFSSIRKMSLCALCANTAAGNAHEYPAQYATEVRVLKTVCYVGNALLAALRHAPAQPASGAETEGT